ncbi:hypothetical protein D3C86_1315670 [compost metagenome]
MRPDNRHQRTDHNRRQRADNRHKARAAEETEELRQRDFVEAMMQCAGHETNHHAAEHAGFKGLDTERHPLTDRARVFMRQRAGEDQQRIDGGIHHQKGEQCRKPGGAFIRFRQPNGHPNGKQHRKVGKHNRPGAAHNRKYGLKPADIQERVRG